MLLNVITTAEHIDDPVDRSAFPQPCDVTFHVMNNPILVVFRHLDDPNTSSACLQPSGVRHLPTAGWIEGSTIQNHRRTGPAKRLDNCGVEFSKKGIGVIETFSHSAS